jgi:ABC-type bacteriocin/lantibiotic exporter with double-glycine peptidase domain
MQSMTTLGEVEPYQQIEKYSCGAATLKAVLKHYGDDHDERALIKLVGVDPKSGSSAHQVADAARKLGFNAEPFSFDSIDELKKYTDHDVPVIVAIRSFTRPDQGHFVVATRVDNRSVYVMDPNVAGNRRTLARDEMDRRWRFRDRTGVIITNSRPPRGRRNTFGGRLASADGGERKSLWAAIAIGVGALAATTATVLFVRRRRAASAVG